MYLPYNEGVCGSEARLENNLSWVSGWDMSNSEPTTCDPVNLLVTHGLSIPSLGMVGRDRRGASQGWRRRRKQSTPLLSLYLLRPPSSNCGFMLVLDSLLLWILTSCVCPHLSFAHTGYPPGQDRHPETLTLLLSMCKDGIYLCMCKGWDGSGWLRVWKMEFRLQPILGCSVMHRTPAAGKPGGSCSPVGESNT